ncbi:MAG: MFS transporter [Gemmatimonadota bacterium]|nr:MFS transporter [Gemmatimonadota bacterium]
MRDHSSAQPLLLDANLRVIFSITLMAMLGVASVTPAFPRISTALDVTPEAVGWLISAFTVPGVFLAPVLGVAADRFGRKRILVPSLLVFGLAGAACGLARDFEVLLALRFLQGVGGAALGSLNVTLIGDLYDGGRRTTAFGYNAGVLSIGTAVYPAIGGALALLAWYVPFFLPILAVPVAFFVLSVLKYPEPRSQTALGTYLRSALQLVRSGQLLLLFTTGVVIFILIYGAYLTFLPFVLERLFGATPLGIGVVFAAASLATAVGAFLVGKLAQLTSQRRLILIGFVLYSVTMGAIPLVEALWLIVALAMAFGFANGITVPTVITLVAGTTSGEHRAIIMSVNGMVLRLGQTVGPLIAGLAYAWLGLGAAFWVCGGLALGMLIVLGIVEVKGER